MTAGRAGGTPHETHAGASEATPTTVDVSELVRLRTHHPEAIAEAAARRTRRPLLDEAGRLR